MNYPADRVRAITQWLAAGLIAFTLLADHSRAAVLEALPPSATAVKGVGYSYEQWVAACRKLPRNRELRGRLPSKELLPLRTFDPFDLLLAAFFEQCKTGALRQPNSWVGEMPEKDGFFNTAQGYFDKTAGAPRFRPFAQKLEVPESSQVFFHGDFHGDIHSFITCLAWLNEQKYLEGFRVARKDFYMVFLGDYTDRGLYGTEVLYTLLQLKLANPDRVLMARGNHEDISLMARYGFLQEGRAKFGAAFDAGRIARAYDFLPVVIYLACGGNVIQCNHGGMEPGYNPRTLLAAEGAARFQLLGKIQQKVFLAKHPAWPAEGDNTGRALALRGFENFEPEDPIAPTVLGFMWNDFSVQSSEPQLVLDPGRAFVFGEHATRAILQSASSTNHAVQAVFRAHQHSSVLNPMMRRLVASSGLFRHWQSSDSAALLNASPQQLNAALEQSKNRAIPSGSVWTFNVSPDSAYGEGCGFSFDTFGILTTARAFKDWRVQVVNTPPRP